MNSPLEQSVIAPPVIAQTGIGTTPSTLPSPHHSMDTALLGFSGTAIGNPAETHQVLNIGSELPDINLFDTDLALQEALTREGADWAKNTLHDFGARMGSQHQAELGAIANKVLPELHTHDRFGQRVDQVDYHPAYHELMKTAIEQGLHASPWTAPVAGAHVARAAQSYLDGQIEAGHGCPITMTFASVPSLLQQPALAELFNPLITSGVYDPRNVPFFEKKGLTVGMGMTEKQGGSDVRANTTRAVPLTQAESAKTGIEPYSLTGHKWFLSAPMCDLFLVLAQTEGGLSCFLVPRYRPDGSKNGLHVIRLKDKMGNQSNASSEVEFREALGWRVGAEGRGVSTIIEMVSLTRFDCMVGSSALMRRGLVLAIHHASVRSAFGKKLIDQPLMQNVMADLALESEAALMFSMRVARALDQRTTSSHEADFLRLATAVGKYWICKRTPPMCYEIMECIGGSGVMENSPFPRLYREAVINPIWEGSGNVQCLDVLRVLQKEPDALKAFLLELSLSQGKQDSYDAALGRIHNLLAQPATLESQARVLVDLLASTLQAGLMLQHAPAAHAQAFCDSRLGQHGQHHFGTLSAKTPMRAIIDRAFASSR